MASGLDPARCILFRQGDVHEHTELCWLLCSVTAHGDLNRMHQFKEKSAQQRELVSAGLFLYPVLQAADVLAYRAQEVPVGDDQRQHVELMRDIALRFNATYGEVLVAPEHRIPEVGARIMDLQEPTRKMSTTVGTEQGLVYVDDEPDAIRRKLKRAVADSGREVVRAPDKPGISNLIEILAVVRGASPASIEQEFDGAGYGDFKWRSREELVASARAGALALPRAAPRRGRPRGHAARGRRAGAGTGRARPWPTFGGPWASALRPRLRPDGRSPPSTSTSRSSTAPSTCCSRSCCATRSTCSRWTWPRWCWPTWSTSSPRGSSTWRPSPSSWCSSRRCCSSSRSSCCRPRRMRRPSSSPARPPTSCSRGCSSITATAAPQSCCASGSSPSAASSIDRRRLPAASAAGVPRSGGRGVRARAARPRASAISCAFRRRWTCATCPAPAVSLDSRLAHLRELLSARVRFAFDDAVAGADRMTQAVTLFALLELYKAGEATWEQSEPFAPITVSAG